MMEQGTAMTAEPAAPVIPAPVGVQAGVVVDVTKTGVVPIRTQMEFTAKPGQIDPAAQVELQNLEREIEAELRGERVPPIPAGLAAPALPVPPQAAAPVAPAVLPPQAAAPQAPAPAAQQPAPPQGEPAPSGLPNMASALNSINELLEIERRKMAPPQPQYPQQPAYGYPQAPQGGYGYPQQPPQQPSQPMQIPFEQRLENDLRVAPVQTLVNLQRAAVATARDEANSRVRDLEMKLELMQIAQSDPSVFSPQGIQELVRVRAERPWLDASPTPWHSAYEIVTGRRGRSGGAVPSMAGGPPQVPAAPVPARPVAPVVPGGYAPAALAPVGQSPVGVPSITNQAELRTYLDQKFPGNVKAQADFLEQVMRRVAAGGSAR